MDSRASCEGINREGRLADRVDTAQVRPQGHRTTFRIPARSAREVAGLKFPRTFSRSITAKKPSSLVASAMTFHATRYAKEWRYLGSAKCTLIASSTATISALDKVPIWFLSRALSAAMIWSAIALLLCPPTVTTVSPGFCRPVLLVNGPTTTRARFRLAALLLTMTAGRVLRISLPTAGSNSTHHTSLRCIGHVSGKSVAPLHRFGFARLVGSHRPVAIIERRIHHMRP